MTFRRFLVASLLVRLLAGHLEAGEASFHSATEMHPPAAESRFDRGEFELSLMSGLLISPVDLGRGLFPRTSTSLDYTQTELRLGVMLNTPWEAGILRGNFEALVGLGGGAIVHGSGTAIANGDIFFRYNFIPRRSWVVPYWQIGLGLNASDVARHQDQRLIGRTLEFTIQSSLGVRVLINPRWSLDLEGIYQHISNAGTVDRNVGVNALGGLIGATFSL